MGVFLRWGVFGILAVAALVYAYNALGRLADQHKGAHVTPGSPVAHEAPEVAVPADVENPPAAPVAPDSREAISVHCRVELDIARRAAEARSIGEPLDRVLRIQEIAWEEDEKRRARYTELATRWYDAPTPVDAARLRRDVLANCDGATP